MNLNISREWLLRMAEKEANGIISVGGLVVRVIQAEAKAAADTGMPKPVEASEPKGGGQ